MEENSDKEIQKLSIDIENAITGIPKQTRRNFFKAFKQLCTGAIADPRGLLEERTSALNESSKRIDLLNNQAQSSEDEVQISREFIAKASAKSTSKVLREQANLDDITLQAARELAKDIGNKEPNEDENSTNPTEEIEDDWLNEFESHARLKSSEEMKLIFGKILLGEISKPGSFSIRTVRLISQLDAGAAKLFQTLCSNSISIRFGNTIFDARVVSLNGNAASNSLTQYGLAFDNLNVLQEYGLIISDYNSFMGYAHCIANENNQVSGTIYFNNKHYGLTPIDREKFDKELKLYGVALTKAGKELLEIIPIQANPDYQKALIEYFERKHLHLVEVKIK